MKTVSRAFTLIELLVVVLIISLLIGIGFVAGRQVITSQRGSSTQNTIRQLDSMLGTYITVNGAIPPAFREMKPLNNRISVVGDVVDPAASPARLIRGTAHVLLQVEAVPAAASVINAIEPRLIRVPGRAGPTSTNAVDGFGLEDNLRDILDAWGNPIRYVHPLLDGVINDNPPKVLSSRADSYVPAPAGFAWVQNRIRRNNSVPSLTSGDPDADGGKCQNGQPYFYSQGPDGKVGYVDSNTEEDRRNYNADNVYAVRPSFQGRPVWDTDE
ncbi:MAG: type II secretion system protein [Planctomycetota bacterium]|nr:type II secretion system protein [Planctomycetota bacterium]